jgi:GT2 family glycosyltransferase
MRKAKIGVGIVTYQRPEYFKAAYESVKTHLGDIADEVIAYHDGPLPETQLGYGYDPFQVQWGVKNCGVAYAKNWLIKELLNRGCDYLFIMEDDIEILDRKAIVGYLAAHRLTGIPHLNFHGHGNNLEREPLAISENGLTFWPNAVGAWSFYTREAIEQVGLMDENFVNAYEHVEHSWRIYKGRLDYGFWPDVLGSEQWLRAQPYAISNSSIRKDEKKWKQNILAGYDYWRSKDPECPAEEPIVD